MSSLSADQLLRYAESLQGEELRTLAGRATFRVHVLSAGLEIIPRSGNSRRVPRKKIQEVCDEYERSRATSPGHYNSITFDASYLLTIIHQFQKQRMTG